MYTEELLASVKKDWATLTSVRRAFFSAMVLAALAGGTAATLWWSHDVDIAHADRDLARNCRQSGAEQPPCPVIGGKTVTKTVEKRVAVSDPAQAKKIAELEGKPAQLEAKPSSTPKKVPTLIIPTTPGDRQKKVDLLDELSALSSESVPTIQDLGRASYDWRNKIISDRPSLLAALNAESNGCAAIEKKFIDFRQRAQIFNAIWFLSDWSCESLGKTLAEAKKTIRDLGDATGGNPRGIYFDKGVALEDARGKSIEHLAAIKDKALEMRKQISQ